MIMLYRQGNWGTGYVTSKGLRLWLNTVLSEIHIWSLEYRLFLNMCIVTTNIGWIIVQPFGFIHSFIQSTNIYQELTAFHAGSNTAWWRMETSLLCWNLQSKGRDRLCRKVTAWWVPNGGNLEVPSWGFFPGTEGLQNPWWTAVALRDE